MESEADARVYEAVYQVAKQYLKSERSLTFLAPGTQSKVGAYYTGCDAVRRIVRQLADLGNRSVLGLIDWDGKNQPDQRVLVLAQGTRNGIENCLLDPLLLLCLVARDAKKYKEEAGFASDESLFHLKQMGQDRIQNMVDSVQQIVLRGSEFDARSVVHTRYADGIQLNISTEILSLDDHELEARVLDRFPPLLRYRQKGQLMMHVAEDILPDVSEYIPMDVIDTFADLLNTEL